MDMVQYVVYIEMEMSACLEKNNGKKMKMFLIFTLLLLGLGEEMW